MVSFIDGLNAGRLVTLIKRARFLIVPDREEQEESAILTALVNAVPCVTFDVPAFRHIFPQGRLIAGESTPEALAAKVVELLENEALAQKLTDDIRANFYPRNWDNIADILWSHSFRR